MEERLGLFRCLLSLLSIYRLSSRAARLECHTAQSSSKRADPAANHVLAASNVARWGELSGRHEGLSSRFSVQASAITASSVSKYTKQTRTLSLILCFWGITAQEPIGSNKPLMKEASWASSAS
jgi:hypothetical protein